MGYILTETYHYPSIRLSVSLCMQRSAAVFIPLAGRRNLQTSTARLETRFRDPAGLGEPASLLWIIGIVRTSAYSGRGSLTEPRRHCWGAQTTLQEVSAHRISALELTKHEVVGKSRHWQFDPPPLSLPTLGARHIG